VFSEEAPAVETNQAAPGAQNASQLSNDATTGAEPETDLQPQADVHSAVKDIVTEKGAVIPFRSKRDRQGQKGPNTVYKQGDLRNLAKLAAGDKPTDEDPKQTGFPRPPVKPRRGGPRK
jgi:hypothetical protein